MDTIHSVKQREWDVRKGKKKALQLARLFKQLQIVGGLDGTRTRDPLRDRQVF